MPHVYAIGDLHLHFQSELKAPGQLHEPVWKNHDVVFRQNCEKLVRPEDTLVLVGDHSWGRKLPEKQRQKKIVEAIKMGMSLDPNMTPEMIEEYTPAIEQIIMTYAKYGK